MLLGALLDIGVPKSSALGEVSTQYSMYTFDLIFLCLVVIAKRNSFGHRQLFLLDPTF